MAQTLYTGGTILTMEQPLYAQALLEEDGRILAVGERSAVEAQARESVRRVDLGQKTLMPAFLDPHSHLMAYANAMLQVPLGECADRQELCDRLARFVQEEQVPPGTWVKGTGYDHNTMDQGVAPDRWQLDQACPQHPVVIQHASGHVGVFNSLALQELGVDEETPCPEGGVMGRDDQGRLTGYMEENAFLTLLQKIPMDDPAALLNALGKAQDRYASYGITTVQEGMLMDAMVPLYQEAIRQNLLKLDVVAYVDRNRCQKVEEVFSAHWGCYRNRFKLGGDKIFLDGSPQGRTAWMRQPYAGEEDYRGYPILTEEQLAQRITSALERGVQLLAHCNGDGAAEQYLNGMEQVEREKGKKLARPVMIHAQLVGQDQLSRMAPLGMIPSFFVAHVYQWGDIHVKNFGRERAAAISPAGSARKLGLPFTFHQDTPVLPPDMLHTVWCAVNRRTRSGQVLGAEEAVPVLEALKAVTIHAAYQYFEEGEKGSLRPGKQANFVILGQNPLETPPEQLKDIPVLETICRGETIYKR